MDKSVVTPPTVCGDPSLGLLLELFGFSVSSTGDALGFIDELSFAKLCVFESSFKGFSKPLMTIFATAVTFCRLRDFLSSFVRTSRLPSPSSSESEYSSLRPIRLSDARTVKKEHNSMEMQDRCSIKSYLGLLGLII